MEAYLKAKKKRKKNEKEVPCKVLITAGHRDVDEDVFQSIHNNGLVYNGRLIVDKNFNTTDPSIFAGCIGSCRAWEHPLLLRIVP